jgi:RNA polymerase sigma-70 factor (ECF subfamily)
MILTDHGSDLGSSESLVYRIAAGEKTAEQELVEKYWKSLFFIINRQAQDKDLAQDITQEAFVVVICKAREGKIENPQSLSAFVRQVGINLLIGNYRKEARRKTDSDEHIDVLFPELTDSLSKKLSNEKLTQIVKQVMNELPTERDKDLLYRYFVYGQNKQQICDEFELTRAHFDRVLHRARSRLKQILQVKLETDLSQIGISQLLTAVLIFNLLVKSDLTYSQNLFSKLVREYLTPEHITYIAVRDEPSYQLDSEQHQQKTRLL